MRLIIAIVLSLLALPAGATELKIATWNLDWLTLRADRDPALPPDVHPRHAEDFDRLRQYALELNADVIGFQEVDGRNAAMQVFPPERYSVHLTHDLRVQRVGVAVRRGLHYEVNPDLTALETDPSRHLRSGADITLLLPEGRLRMLVVHLKTGCPEQSLNRSNRRSCAELRDQIAPLQAWIAARQQEAVPFLLIGDFNRTMDGRDQLWAALKRTAPLVRANEGHTSPCWGHEAFIDHIIAGGAARDWVDPDSLRVTVYRETGAEWKDRLSDHCPVSVRLRPSN